MLKIGITEPESEIRTVRRQPNSVGYALPENCPKDGGVRTFRFTSVAGRRQALNPQEPATLFLPLQSASHLRPCDAGGHARAVPGRALGKEGIMHATLSPSWKKSLLLVFVSVVAFVTATPATSGPQCFFQGLGFLPGRDSSSAAGVSANGTVVVGFSNRPHFPGIIPPEAFRWTAASGMVGLGFLAGGNFSNATGVNADGTVVVGRSLDASGRGQAFRWTAASGMVGLGSLPGGNLSGATGVNADGTVVVGESSGASGLGQAFRWTAETGMVGLGFLPGGIQSFARGVNANGTVVVGQASEAPTQFLQAFRWTAASGMVGLGSLPGDNLSGATGVNADGTVVVGGSSAASGRTQAFRWVNGTMTGLGFLPGGSSSGGSPTGFIVSVNANGKVVVGSAGDASGQLQAFRWTARTRMQSVLTLLQAAKVDVNLFAGWQLRSANGVSADGTVIVGDGVDPLGQSQGWIARLPKESNEDCEEDDDNQGDNDNQGESTSQ
jgi:probable HAF family extracellular repeat protein